MKLTKFKSYVCEGQRPEKADLEGYLVPNPELAIITAHRSSPVTERIYEDQETINFIKEGLRNKKEGYLSVRSFEVEDIIVTGLINAIKRADASSSRDINNYRIEISRADFAQS